MCRMCLVEVEGPRGATLQPACFVRGHRRHGGRHRHRQGQEGPGRGARVPPGQPPPRLPGVRQGRRVPAAGPDAGLRAGREPLRRGEAPLREAHRHLRPRAARPRALHPVRPLHPLRRRGGRRGADRLRRAAATRSRWPPSRPSRSPRTSAATRCRSARSARSPRRPTASPPAPGTSTRSSPPAPPARSGCRVAVQSSQNRLTRLLGIDSRPGEPRLAVRQGPLRLRGGQRRRGRRRPAAERAGRRGRRRGARHRLPGGQPRCEPGPVPRRGPRDGPLRARAPRRAAHPQGGRAGPGQLGRGPGRGGGRASRRPRTPAAPGAVALIGGARLTNEAAYAWAKLAKGVIGTDSVDAQLGDGLPAELVLGLPRATIDEACAAPVLVTLAGDLREELPVLFLRLREAVVGGTTALVELAPTPTALTPLAAVEPAHPPGRRAGCWPGRSRVTTAPATALGTHHEGAALAPGALDAARTRAGGAPRRRGRGRRGRPPVLRRGGRGGGRGAARRWPPRCPRRPSCPPCAGATCSAPSTWASRPGSCRAGSASTRAGPGSPPPGARCPRPPGCRRPRSSPPWRASVTAAPQVQALVLLGADPLSDFPDRALAEKALVGRALRGGGDGPPVRVGRRARRRRAARARWPTSGRARRPTSRAGSAASGPSSWRPASPGRTG